jgi:cytochrome c553
VDEWPDNAKRDPEAATWGRLSKVGEEAGEVIKEYIGVTGQNPRKGVSGTMQGVRDELLDTAITALAAYEHTTGNRGESMLALQAFIEGRMRRAGLY